MNISERRFLCRCEKQGESEAGDYYLHMPVSLLQRLAVTWLIEGYTLRWDVIYIINIVSQCGWDTYGLAFVRA